MAKKDEYMNIRIKKRPWWQWTLMALLIIWVIFWLDIIIGSFKEIEPRAAWIGIIVLIISIALTLFLPAILRKKPWIIKKK